MLLAIILWRKREEGYFPETLSGVKNYSNSPYGKFHRFLFPLSHIFPGLNFVSYVLYIYPCWAWVTFVTANWHLPPLLHKQRLRDCKYVWGNVLPCFPHVMVMIEQISFFVWNSYLVLLSFKSSREGYGFFWHFTAGSCMRVSQRVLRVCTTAQFSKSVCGQSKDYMLFFL